MPWHGAMARWLWVAGSLLVAPVAPPFEAVAETTYAAGDAAFEAGEFAEAHRIWRELAEQGDGLAQFGLGLLHENGLGGTTMSLERAAYWYGRAAEQGVNQARNNLALLYASGRVPEHGAERAFELWRAAAEDGHTTSIVNLALAYTHGIGTEPDLDRARDWHERAAIAGSPDAAFLLGKMYEAGTAEAVPDMARARHWYREAASLGHPEARQRVAALEPGPPAATDSVYFAQLGAFENAELARRELDAGFGRRQADDRRLDIYMQKSRIGEQVLYRVLFGVFAAREGAERFCARMRAGGRQCIVIGRHLD